MHRDIVTQVISPAVSSLTYFSSYREATEMILYLTVVKI